MQICNAIEISYFVGKTLLLMAKVFQMNQLYRDCVVFVVDGFFSSNIFQNRISLFCNERNIAFHSIDLYWQIERERFEDIIKSKPDCLVIDELHPHNFDYVCDVTRELSQVVCVINPEYAKPENFHNNRNGFKIIRLTSVMRNTAQIYNTVNSADQSDYDVQTSTVLGNKPVMVCILKDDLLLGLTEAVAQASSNKFVIIRENVDEFPNSILEAVLTTVKPDVPVLYANNSDDRPRFLSDDQSTGCLIAD